MTKFETSNYDIIKSALVNRDLKQALYDEGKVIMDGVLLTLHGEDHSCLLYTSDAADE